MKLNRRQRDSSRTNKGMIDTLKEQVITELISLDNYPVDFMSTCYYIDKLESMFVSDIAGELVDDEQYEDIGYDFNPTFDDLDEIQSGVIDKFVKELVRLKDMGESKTVLDTILTAELLEEATSSSNARNVMRNIDIIMKDLKGFDWIDKDVSLELIDKKESMTIEIKYKGREVIVPKEVEDSFTLAYNLININSENVVYVDKSDSTDYIQKTIYKGDN